MFRFLPWRFLIKHAARRYGVIDPLTILARMRGFAQASEVSEPIELLRAGIVFHARGLVNAKVIQHNLDWVWPYWVERQFNPEDLSFVPRAFSFSHINLTHRNWTAVGLPDMADYPIVDPRGLVTPLYDGWSIDFPIQTDSGRKLVPSRVGDDAAGQHLELEPVPAIETNLSADALQLKLRTRVERSGGSEARVVIEAEALADEDGWLIASVRPYNPEGVQFIDHIEFDSSKSSLKVNGSGVIAIHPPPDEVQMAGYGEGDVLLRVPGEVVRRDVRCKNGLATASIRFRLKAGVTRSIALEVSLPSKARAGAPSHTSAAETWHAAMSGTARLKVPDEKIQFLYDAAVKTLLMLSADVLYPGPYTYRRFWFRDACLMLHPMLALGLVDRAEQVLSGFAALQTMGGYFQSQEGEWDSNGQVLWIAARYTAMTGRPLDPKLDAALRRGVRWLAKKRLPSDAPNGTGGLLPAGFSAEHLGPNDFYYWDDFWAIGGLRAISEHWKKTGDFAAADEASKLADAYLASVESSLKASSEAQRKNSFPAAPSRRMDAGAIGSMVADYPLQLYPAGETRVMNTARYLIGECFHKGGFFQEMIHSGINAYLTLDLAQTLLRSGDADYAKLIQAVADLASPTGQWPEAIHPNTLGGCMGDGQHGWAAAEWIMMLRNCFVREEEADNLVVIGSGIMPEWTEGEVRFGPTATAWGEVSVSLLKSDLTVDAKWRGKPPRIRIAVPGHARIEEAQAGTHRLERILP